MDGLFILADDALEEMIVACLNSLRVVEPDIPICFIPFHLPTPRMHALARNYGAFVWEKMNVLESCDELSLSFHGRRTGHYRKLAAWMGEFERFIYLDVDTIVLRPLQFVFRLLENFDVLTAVSNHRKIRQFVWTDEVDQAEINIDTHYAANTGFLVSKAGIFSLDSIDRVVREALILKKYMALECAEQPFLNYLITASGVSYSSLSELRKTDKSIPTELWGGRWSGRLLDLSEMPLLVHWAGIWRADLHRASSAWRYFRQLPMPLR